MKSRYAGFMLSLALGLAPQAAHAQPAPANKRAPNAPAPATGKAPAGAPVAAPSAAAPVGTVAPTASLPPPAAAQVAPPLQAAPAPPASFAPPAAQQAAPATNSATQPNAAPGPATQPPATLPPPKFRAPPPTVYVFTGPPIRPKRRYGNAGAPFTVGIGAAMRFRSDSGYRQLHAGKRQNELDLFASYDVFQPVRRIVLAAGISYRHADLGDDDTLAIETNAVQADLIARFTLTNWLFPQLRAGLGAQLSRADLHDSGADFRAHDRSAGAAGSLGGGVLLQTPRRLFETHGGRLSSLAIGLLVEGGYAFASAADYHLKVKAESDLGSPRIALGKLGLSGPYLRIAAVVRF